MDYNELLNIIYKANHLFHENDARNIERELQRKALKETASFVEERMNNVRSFATKEELLEYAIDLVVLKGLFIEFGVYKGETINFISSKVEETVYGFDSFEGLPEDWRDGFPKGVFQLGTLPSVNYNVELINGWFEESLPKFTENHKNNCAFIHIDCDLYTSTKTIFKFLKGKIQSGTVIVFDEYFNYPNWKNGEYKAFEEFIAESKSKFEYIGYNRYHEQVGVRIL
ncbi:class I SAM-dependent methyltransferase [Bacillus marasmi]|uniref:class I SAM-dependent methyltransferase n=1 Tax=Bacillus marasmi TaxID=1926279 RepID=UPI0011CBB7DA|nr:class I SAM-dependent methyltransferase [Bacillus marasmi]